MPVIPGNSHVLSKLHIVCLSDVVCSWPIYNAIGLGPYA